MEITRQRLEQIIQEELENSIEELEEQSSEEAAKRKADKFRAKLQAMKAAGARPDKMKRKADKMQSLKDIDKAMDSGMSDEELLKMVKARKAGKASVAPAAPADAEKAARRKAFQDMVDQKKKATADKKAAEKAARVKAFKAKMDIQRQIARGANFDTNTGKPITKKGRQMAAAATDKEES